MDRHFFNLVDIPEANIHFLNGMVPAHQLDSHCSDYEKKITRARGLSRLQLRVPAAEISRALTWRGVSRGR